MSNLNLTQIDIIKELANQYSAIPEQFLFQALGREASLDEFSTFIDATVANILGGMYGILREQKNPPEGEAWLKGALAHTSALVRSNGADAIIKFDVTIKEVPNTLHKKQQPVVAPMPKEAPPLPVQTQCPCQVDAQGKCVACSGLLSNYFQGVYEPFIKMKELGEKLKGVCPICQGSQTDRVLAVIFPDLLKAFQDADPAKKRIFAKEVFLALCSMAQMMGTKEMPLTNKVYTEAVAQ